jgi:putative transposase
MKLKKKEADFSVFKALLFTTDHDERVLNARFEAARQFYNSILGTTRRRLNAYRNHASFIAGKKLLIASKGQKLSTEQKDEIHNFFREAATATGYYLMKCTKNGRTNSLEQMCSLSGKLGSSWLKEHLDSHVKNALAKRAFEAVEKVKKRQAKKVRFRRKGETFSITGKDYKSPLKYRADGVIVWMGLELKCLLQEDDELALSMSRKMKENPSIIGVAKILRRRVKKKWRYFAQVTCSTPAFLKEKNKLGTGEIGIDVGVLDVAVATPTSVELLLFCQAIQESLGVHRRQLRKLQRKLSRQLGPKNNPDAYDEKGVLKKGVRLKFTKGAVTTKMLIAEMQDRQQQLRKSLHGQMVNRIRSLGDVLKLEKVSYKAWQRMHGRGTNVGAAGLFVALLKRKFINTGGRVVEFDTRNTKCSRLCPSCGHYNEKKHPETFTCEKCRFSMQRDKCSSILAYCYDEKTGSIDLEKAKARICDEALYDDQVVPYNDEIMRASKNSPGVKTTPSDSMTPSRV